MNFMLMWIKLIGLRLRVDRMILMMKDKKISFNSICVGDLLRNWFRLLFDIFCFLYGGLGLVFN